MSARFRPEPVGKDANANPPAAAASEVDRAEDAGLRSSSNPIVVHHRGAARSSRASRRTNRASSRARQQPARGEQRRRLRATSRTSGSFAGVLQTRGVSATPACSSPLRTNWGEMQCTRECRCECTACRRATRCQCRSAATRPPLDGESNRAAHDGVGVEPVPLPAATAAPANRHGCMPCRQSPRRRPPARSPGRRGVTPSRRGHKRGSRPGRTL